MAKRSKIEQKLERQFLLEAGFYDGRFAPKRVPNKKKKAQKNWARNNK